MHVELEGPVQHAMDTEDELEGSVAIGGGWHRAGGRGELEGPVQHAMDTEDELEGSVQRSQRLA